MDNLIQDFQNQLCTYVPELQYIDEDWGQYDFFDRPPTKDFSVLIDIQSAQYTNDGKLQQRGNINVVVRFYNLKLTNSSSKAPQRQKDYAKKGWQILRKINQALHGQHFLSEGYAVPIRQSMQRIKRRDGIYQRDITYTIGLTDNSCVPIRKTIPAQPTIKAQIEQV